VNVLVTGANGFIGRHLCPFLAGNGCAVTALSRRAFSPQDFEAIDPSSMRGRIRPVIIPEMSPKTDFRPHCETMDCVVHLAGRAHVMQETPQSRREFHAANVALTERLGRDARAAGVRRFVFLSSIGVLGNRTTERPFCRRSPAAPTEEYAASKLTAEQRLAGLFTGGEALVIVRPPLVYGPGVKGNFARLIRLVQRLPVLPFGGVTAARSYVHVLNLCSFIQRCLSDSVERGVYVVCDGADLSLPDLLRMIAGGLGRKRWLPPVPPVLLRVLGTALGKRAEVERLSSPLVVDHSEDCSRIGWQPVYRPEEGIAAMVREYQRKAA